MRSIIVGISMMALGLSLALPAQAAMMQGKDLAAGCASGDQLCAGYVMGVLDQWGGLEADLEKLKSCFPQGVTTGVLVGVAKAYMEAHPDKLELTAPEVIVASFKQALAC